MHASLWWFYGDPDELLRQYEAIVADIPPTALRLQLCLRRPDGIVVVDTCPSREAFELFTRGTFDELRRRHGLPEPVRVEDAPVALALVDGQPRG
jgi:hypothetical protein